MKHSLASVLLFLSLLSTPLFAASTDKQGSPAKVLHTPLREKIAHTKQLPIPKSSSRQKKDVDLPTDFLKFSEEQATTTQSSPVENPTPSEENSYRINFTNVSIAEYVRFVAKISGRNFIYQDTDLLFTVTVVSEQSTSVDQVTAALLQILRIHGLSITEQGNNILIYKDATLSKIGPVASDNNSSNSAYTTRVIHLSYLPVLKAKDIVTNLLSPLALVDVSEGTNQLVITDIDANINTVMTLLTALDQPFDALDISSFIAVHSSATTLAQMATRILSPMAELQGIPFVIVDQPATGAVFIVGPKSIQPKALQVLQTLDQPGSHQETNLDVLVYIPKNISPEALLPLAEQILQPIAELEKVPFKMAIQGATNSIFITSTKPFNVRVLEIMQSLDQPSATPHKDAQAQNGPVEVAVFTPTYAKPEAIVSVADQILAPIATAEKVPFSLVIQSSTNSIFISSTRAFNLRIMELLQQLDKQSTVPSVSANVDVKPVPTNTVPLTIEVASYTPKIADAAAMVAVATKILQPIADSEKIPFGMVVQGSTKVIYISSTRAFNIKAIDLLEQLDKPSDQPLADINAQQMTEISSYIPQYSSPDSLLPIAEKILDPIAKAEKVPFTMVIQPLTKAIYISSTRDFNARTIALFKQLDQPPPPTPEKPSPAKSITIEVASYQPQFLPADALLNVAQKIMGPIATADNIPFSMVVQGATNAIFITSTPSFNARVISVLGALDQQPPVSNNNKQVDLPPTNIDTTTFWLYKLQYQTGSQIQTAFNTLGNNLQSYGGANTEIMDVVLNAVWMAGTNSILFTGTANAVYRMQQLMPQIDVPTRQVYIEMLVIQTSLSNSLSFGVQMGALVQTTQGMAYNFGNLNPGSTGSTTTGFPGQFQLPQVTPTAANPSLPTSTGFTLGSIGNFITHGGRVFGSIGSLVNALQTENDTKIIINPKIVAVDSHQSQIFVGSNTPFTTANVTVQAAQSSNAFNVDYRDIGTSLQVTPTLGRGDIITLDLVQEIDNIDANTSASINGFPAPTTNKLSSTTRVIVPNGYFLVLSGMIQNQKIYSNSGLPCLGCIPILGAAFSQQTQTYSKLNTIIFIHPRIMDTTEQIAGIGNYEGDEFYWNSKPECCNPDLQTNGFYKNFYRPYESVGKDLPQAQSKSPSLAPPPRVARAYPPAAHPDYVGSLTPPSQRPAPFAPACPPPPKTATPPTPPKPPKRPSS